MKKVIFLFMLMFAVSFGAFQTNVVLASSPNEILYVIQKSDCDTLGRPCTLLKLNFVPNGLSGFIFDVNTNVSHVRFNNGLALTNVDVDRVSGVDLSGNIEPGDDRVSLFQFHPPSVNVEVLALDDDNGNVIPVTIKHVDNTASSTSLALFDEK